jgi:hypothetical protein
VRPLDALFDRDAAPVQRWAGDAGALAALAAEAARLPGAKVVDLDGALLPDGPALFRALATALAFPSTFGANWDALDECLADLEWLTETTILLVVRNADHLLEAEPRGLPILLDILGGVARELEEPQMGQVCLRRMPVQFRTLLHAGEATAWTAFGRVLPEL